MKRLFDLAISRLRLEDVLWRFQKRGLYCVNFHRIGDWRQTKFDPCVFSCDAENFRDYLKFFKDNFSVIGLSEVEQMIESDQQVDERLLVITFDDGYVDNFSEALPILREMRMTATFFITTGLVDSGLISWWDEIAWYVKQFQGDSLYVNGWKKPVGTSYPDDRESIRAVLQQVKSSSVPLKRQLEELRNIVGGEGPSHDGEQLFMSWPQLRQMVADGMSIGAHSHTHDLFSSLLPADLEHELVKSKAILEEKLGIQITALSYPVGKASTFTSNMFPVVKQCGYKMAFSFEPEIHRNVRKRRFQLGRLSVDAPFDRRNFLRQCILTPKE